MSDRVVVMNHGEIRQVGTPEEVYSRPSDSFVANFVGEVNLWPVTVDNRARDSDGTLVVAVRPERVWVWRPGDAAPRPEIQLAALRRRGAARWESKHALVSETAPTRT